MIVEFAALVAALDARGVRYLVIGVGGANFYAPDAGLMFATQDLDLFLPPDPTNLLAAWEACEFVGLELSVSGEPLDRPRDTWLAQRIVDLRALTRARDDGDLKVDLTLVMAGFEFVQVWPARHTFELAQSALEVAALRDILRSKALADRPKDRLFLSTHKDALQQHFGVAPYDYRVSDG
jgi:hypothetical protein